MSELLHPVYLPFTREQLRQHFAAVGTDTTSADRHLEYYLKSAEAAKAWEGDPAAGSPGEVAKAKKYSLQIQKDERFWVATALMSLFHSPQAQVAALGIQVRLGRGGVLLVPHPRRRDQRAGDGRICLWRAGSLDGTERPPAARAVGAARDP